MRRLVTLSLITLTLGACGEGENVGRHVNDYEKASAKAAKDCGGIERVQSVHFSPSETNHDDHVWSCVPAGVKVER